jgi:hypothetical protein
VLTVDDKHLDTFALLLLVIIWSHSAVQWYFTVPFTTLAGFALFYSKLRTSWIFWLSIAAIHGFALAQLWYFEGNGLFLFFYATLTMTLALASGNPAPILRINARYLIGFVFLFAVLWKLLTPDFRSGHFMEYYLLTDNRVAPVATILTPLTRVDIKGNQKQVEQLPNETIQLHSKPRVHLLALMLTYLTLIVEGLVAIVFLLPVNPLLRDGTFISFLISGYLTVTVPSFGMILACLGFAQSSNPKTQLFYKVTCLLLPLIKIRFYLTV